MRRFHALLAVVALAVVSAGSLSWGTATAQEEPSGTAWCARHGGKVVARYPARNVSSGSPVALSHAVRFCEFTGGDGADPPDSRISVRMTTLAASELSMAASAYLTKPAMPESGGSANPASVYCASLGGAEIGGVLAPDGGWVNTIHADDVVQMCVFPDLSIIDSWGLAYHTMGTIRGANLGPLFRATLPETGL
jgi:putative hemolysin